MAQKELNPTEQKELVNALLARLGAVAGKAFDDLNWLDEELNRERDLRLKAEETLNRSLTDCHMELERTQKVLVENESLLAESKRAQASQAARLEQLSDSLKRHQADVVDLRRLNEEIRSLRSDYLALQAAHEEGRVEAARQKQMDADALECVRMQHAQEKMACDEAMQSLRDQLLQASDGLKASEARCRALEAQYELEREENERARRSEKIERDKLTAELAQVRAKLADANRQNEAELAACERRFQVALSNAEARYRQLEESAHRDLEERERQINLLQFRIKQNEEDNRRALEALRQQYNEQLAQQVEEARGRAFRGRRDDD